MKVTPAEEKNHAKGGFNVQDDHHIVVASHQASMFAHLLLAEHWNLNHLKLKAQWFSTLTFLQLSKELDFVCFKRGNAEQTNKKY